MTGRLADITARIDGIRQLGMMMNAMRGIAGSRAQQARAQLRGVETYRAAIAEAIGSALALAESGGEPARRRPRGRHALVVFCAEQGFAGAFSERIFDGAGAGIADAEVFLVGTRGANAALQHGIKAVWTSAMPYQSLGVPRLADRIARALYARLVAGEITSLEVVFGRWQAGRGVFVERRQLFPIEPADFPQPTRSDPPLLNLDAATLLSTLTGDYIHAELCDAALHAFAAENEARMEAMTSARQEIERRLADLVATQRIVRQEEITAEIIELAAGEAASRAARRKGRAPGGGEGKAT